MAVDVVVVNYKTKDLLWGFVDSFIEHQFPGCTLTHVEVEADNYHPLLLTNRGFGTIAVAENIGYAKACNIGAQHGTNDVILLANADTVLSAGFKECYDALMERPDWGILGPRQVNEMGHITAGGIFGTDQSIGQRGWNEIDHGQYSDIREDAKSVSGSLYFIKRKLWDLLTNCEFMQTFQPGSIGAFINTPHYYEETCCSYHARAHGYKIVYYGAVQMLHHWHKASAHGGWADKQVEISKAMMRDFCRLHSIVCE